MSLISQNVIPNNKRKKPVEEPPAAAADGSALADADGANELGAKPESEPTVSKKKRSREVDEKSRMEQEMESSLFVHLYALPEFGKEVEEAVTRDAALFSVGKSTGDEKVVYEEDLEAQAEKEEIGGERKLLWVDEEGEKAKINITRVQRLRKLRMEPGEKVVSGKDYIVRLYDQHAKLNPATEWAKIDRKSNGCAESDDESNDVLRSNEELVVKSRVRLEPGSLEYSRLMDANREEPSDAPINSVQFHRNGQLLLAAGLNRALRLFQVDGQHNTIVASIFINDCPIIKASFMPDGSQVILSGRRKFFYSYDLVKLSVDKIGPLMGREEKSLESFEVSPDSKTIAFIGNEGYILLVSSRTKELIGTLKMNGTVRSLAFVDGGQQLMSSGGDGQVYHWDLRMRKCIHKAVDVDCITGSALCASADSGLFAVGSESGIVNVYKRKEFLGGKGEPLKTIENLTTKVDFTKFNRDAQILAISSNMKKNSLKLIHIPSFNVFTNWPAANCSLQHPRCLDFSPGGGFMAIGNAAGKVLLYRLCYYQKA